MRKISRLERAGILIVIYILILFVIAAAYFFGMGNNMQSTQSTNVSWTDSLMSNNETKQFENVSSAGSVISNGTENQSANVSPTDSSFSNQTAPDFEVPFVGDLRALSITPEYKVLYKREKGNFTLRFFWDGESNSDKFTLGLYVDNVLVDKSPPGWMDARSVGTYSFYWTANDTGNKNISISLDLYDEITERNESNNNATLNIRVY